MILTRWAALIWLALTPALRAAQDALPTPTGGPPTQPAQMGIPADLDRLYTQYIDSIFDMRFKDAEEKAKDVIARYPEHPAGYFGLAGLAWTKYVYETDQSDQSLYAPFVAKVEEVATIGNKWIKTHPHDPLAMMVVGAAYGIKSRLLTVRGEWIKAYLTGRKAIGITKNAIKADPNFIDAYLGIGMYDYYTDVYPRVIGVLAKLVLRGNRVRGIETLRKVAENGHMSKSCAQILLVEIYTEDAYGARDPEKAIALMKELRARYPNSAMMHSAQLVALYEGKRYDDVIAESRSFIAAVDKGRYNIIEKAKGLVALGCALWAKGQKEEALASFRLAGDIKFQGALSRWAVWAHFRAAQLQDRMGRREDALKDYKTVMAQPDRWGFYAKAKKGIAAPYGSDEPGPIPPIVSN